MTTVPQFGVLHAPDHWRTVDFISDLHLDASEPATFAVWASYMTATPADALFILGDLFEVWIGDDVAVPGSFEARCADVLRQTATHASVYFMRGNRDFLVGADFLARSNVHDLPEDPTVLHALGKRWLLSHGDLLCTSDVAYQQFRQQVRTRAWQDGFLARPLAERQALARQMRAESTASQTSGIYAQTNDELARRWLHAAQASTLIFGHTHQPGDHDLGDLGADGLPLRQRVLSDWHIDAQHRRAQVLRLSSDGRLERIDLDAN